MKDGGEAVRRLLLLDDAFLYGDCIDHGLCLNTILPRLGSSVWQALTHCPRLPLPGIWEYPHCYFSHAKRFPDTIGHKHPTRYSSSNSSSISAHLVVFTC